MNDSQVILRAIHSKNRQPVTVPVVGEIAEIINHTRADRRPGCDYVFYYTKGKDGSGTPKRMGDFYVAWANACEAAGVTGKLFHDFRRSAARNLVAAGVPESVAQKITGHLTNSTFKRYSITSEEQKQDALAHLAEYHRMIDEKQSLAITRLQ